MRRASHLLSASLLACLAAIAVPAHAVQPTASAVVTDLDGTAGNLVRFDITVNGVFDLGDTLNIAFSAGSFASLSNNVVPANFSSSLTQPVQVGQLSGTFSISYPGAGTSAASNHFFVDAIAKQAGVVGMAMSGSGVNGEVTVFRLFGATLPALAPVSPVPEASTLSMLAAGLLAIGLLRRKSRHG